jgi:hypothetical protein
MKQRYSLLDIAKLTDGLIRCDEDGDRYAVKTEDKIFVKHSLDNAYYPVLFEKDLIRALKLILMKQEMSHDARTILHYLAYELSIEDELEQEMFG